MSNRLINESSPYLLQHANNPVNWYPWGDEPFERAKEENKPVLVSIGYAACHWCHVMEHESFENETVAALMNEHFICIKVDREEHPDVDHLYMDAVQAISGSGGWPLNVFTTPERVPFYGGTYYPPRPAYGRASWMQVLERMHEIWTQQSDEVAAQSGQMLQYLKNASVAAVSAKGENWNEETANTITDNLLKLADKVYGGFGQAPKFPGTMAISYLLEHYKYTGNIEAKKHALHSLDAMLAGGINDQLAGGFARYSTDAQWLAPHFEKMLYDNALIIHALCDAYRITKKDRYEHAIRQTISFVENELKDASGGYYSALDADSEGVEGKYYTWTWDEWQEIAGSDDVLSSYFGVKKQGNWEHTNILHEATDIAKLAGETGVSEAEITARVREVKQKLLEARNKRIRPATDDKCLLSWNALMNIALSKAAGVLGDESFRSKAIAHMQWMQDIFIKENTLKHTWKNGLARIDANLEDYAFLVQAMLQLASVSGDNAWITGANSLVQKIIENFSCEDATFFYFSAAGKRDIPVRKTDVYDGALPSANAVMAHNLLILSLCMESVEYRERAYVMLHRISSTVKRYSYSFAYWAMLLQRYLVGLKTVVCTANQASVLHRYCIPEAYIVTSQKEISELPLLKHKISWSENNVFICTQDACMPPMPLLADVLQYFNIPNE